MKLFSAALTAAIASAIFLPRCAVAQVTELDVYNLDGVLSAQQWTCVLFYDHRDEVNTPRYRNVLDSLEDSMKADMGFARLSMRRHNYFHQTYRPEDKLSMGEAFYSEYGEDPNRLLTLSPKTFLNFRLGDIYWPAKLLVFGPQADVFAEKDLAEFSTVADPLKTVLLEDYLTRFLQQQQQLQRRQYQQQLQRRQYKTKPDILYKSSATIEKEREDIYLANLDNDFDFEAYRMEQASEEEDDDALDKGGLGYGSAGDMGEEDPEEQSYSSLRRLLETRSESSDSDDEDEDTEPANKGHFVYNSNPVVVDVEDFKGSNKLLGNLATILEEYTAWVEGYEVSWSPERKAREDEETNFGEYLEQMNDELRLLINVLLGKDAEGRKELFASFGPGSDDPLAAVPNLRAMLLDMVFGYARSPSDLDRVLANITKSLGATPSERRENRRNFDGSEFPIIQRMREYMVIVAQIDKDKERYSLVLTALVNGFNNIMAEFHNNMSQYYLRNLQTHPRRHGNNFQMKPMDVIDMEDPRNHELLGNYDEFNRRYTATGTPVILANANMTHRHFTLDYIVSQCAAVDVTENVQVSSLVGKEKPASGWGGLGTFVLHDTLLNQNRKQKSNSDSSESDSDEDSEDADDEIDRSISMEQFSILYKEIDSLYLHDMSLPGSCNRLLFHKTPYDTATRFQIPSVIGSYDLVQRMAQSAYADTWPSLFVGRKGSNSKLHVDSGGSAFYMYLVSGRKRWIVYNRSERVFTYESLEDATTFADVLAGGKSQTSNAFLSQRFPLMHRAEEAFEIVQEPGQLVYIPPNCPHAVENLEDIVGLAMNIIPREGVATHLHDRFFVDPTLEDVSDAMNYLLFEDNAQSPTATKNPLYTSFGEFKAQF